MDLFPVFIRFMSHSWRVKTCSKMHTFKFLNIPYSFHKHIRFHSQSNNFKRSTIFALSTAPGVSAIAVIRISGPGASDALYKMGKMKQLPESRKAILCRLKDPISEELLDKALVLWFPSPNSFTGEDMCEFHVHGGVAVVKSVLSALMKIQSFRLAEPGEFTKRAFLANKLDLTEIEGLSNLLHAETETQQRQALRQMDGVLNKLHTDWSNRIKKCLANIEAYIDFSEDQHLDNTIFSSVQEDLDKLKQEMWSHMSDFRRGERLRNGVYTALIGKPNVGKSSLLNSLCQRDIAIVSPTAGTTRDVIETSFNLGGHLVNISDTAGIRETEDWVEMEGVKRAKDRLTKADLLIVIFEAETVLKFIESSGSPPDNVMKRILDAELGECFVKDVSSFNNLQEGGENNKVILLLNKVDLLSEEEKEKVAQFAKCSSHVCSISCTEGTGMEAFLNLFSSVVKEMCLTRSGEEPSLTQERHRVFVQNCLRNISEFDECMQMDAALAAEKLRIGMNELGKITGKVRTDDILDVVFRDFCIGK